MRLEGPRVSQALSSALGRGVQVRAVRPVTDEILEIVLSPLELRPFRRAVRGTGNRVRMLRRRGAAFALYRLTRRPGLIVGAALCAIGLGWASSQVWAVRVVGAGPRLGTTVLKEAEHLGLHPGVRRGLVDRRTLSLALERRVKGLAWVGVEAEGGLVIIHAVPESHLEASPFDRADVLVASHGGRVTRVVLTQGIADVKPGDEITRGQILAQGYTVEGATLRDGEPGPPRFVAPRGRIWVKFTTQAVATVPAERTERRTGLWAPAWRLSVGTRILTEGNLAAQAASTKRLQGHPILNFHVTLPYVGTVSATVLRVRAVEVRTVPVAMRTLLPTAVRQAQVAIERKTGPTARVLHETRQIRRVRGRLVLRLADTVEVNVARPGARNGKAE